MGARLGRAQIAERETGFEPATSTLARLHSTTELLPRLPSLARLSARPGTAGLVPSSDAPGEKKISAASSEARQARPDALPASSSCGALRGQGRSLSASAQDPGTRDRRHVASGAAHLGAPPLVQFRSERAPSEARFSSSPRNFKRFLTQSAAPGSSVRPRSEPDPPQAAARRRRRGSVAGRVRLGMLSPTSRPGTGSEPEISARNFGGRHHE